MNRRGFSLYEVMVSLFLLGILFVSAGELAKDFSTMHREQTEESRLGVAARDLLKYLVGESRNAVDVTVAPDTLTLRFLDPSIVRYPPLPLSEDAALPTGWQPDATLLTESYALVGDRLQVDREGAKSVLMGGLSGFEAVLNGQQLQLSLSWRQQRRVVSARRTLTLPRRRVP